MLKGLAHSEFRQLLLSVGKTTRARRPLSPVEVGALCKESIDKGATQKEITKALGMTDTGMISKFVRLSDLIPAVRHLVSWGYSGDGAIGFSVAAQLAQLPEGQQAAAAESILRHNLSKDEMRSVVQLIDRSKQPLKECFDRVVQRRPTVQVRQLVLGGVTSPDTRSKLGSLTQVDRDELLQRIVARLFPTAKDFTAKLGIDRFAIIGSRSLAETVARDPEAEQSINRRLEEELA